MVHDEQIDKDLHFETYPAALEKVTAYTQKNSLKVEVKGHYGLRIMIQLLLWFARSLSWKWAYRIGTGIGLLLYSVRLRRNIAMVNLDIVFGDLKSRKEKNADL